MKTVLRLVIMAFAIIGLMCVVNMTMDYYLFSDGDNVGEVIIPTEEEQLSSSTEEELISYFNNLFNPLTYVPVSKYDDRNYAYTYKSIPVEFDRDHDFGQTAEVPMEPWYHSGGEQLDHDEVVDRIRYIAKRFPNIRTTDELVELIRGTIITEAWFGGAEYDTAYARGDIGLLQFRIGTAKHLLKWLDEYKVRPDVYKVLMSYYDNSMSLEENLLTNVDFSIAMAIQEYWRKLPQINNIECTVLDDNTARGLAWKSDYNTMEGVGTINDYVNRVEKFDALLSISELEIVIKSLQQQINDNLLASKS